SVIIVGAGIAGLRCAQVLKEELPEAGIIVLEAADGIGGRIQQDTTFVPGMTLELGAEFLHGSATSMTQLARRLHLPTQELFTWAQGDGGPLPPASGPGHALYYLGRERRLLRAPYDDADFAALNAALLDMCETDAATTERDARSVLQWLAQDQRMPARMAGMAEAGFGNTVGAPLREISYSGSCHLAREWEVDGEGDFRLTGEGLRAIVQHVAAGANVVCNWPAARVECCEGAGGRVVVTCRDGRRVAGTHAVIAVPLSVMQDGGIEFSPQLPPAKLAALQCFGMGRAVKVLLKFSQLWFDQDLHGLICADMKFPEFWFRPVPECDSHECTDKTKAVVVAFASGAFADAVMDSASDEQVFTQVLEQLDVIFGPISDHPNPASDCFLGAKIVDWKTEYPFIRGGYSYPKQGHKAGAGGEIAAPEGDHLFFAGEHTNAAAGMTLHAAYDTGTRAALEVVQAIGAAATGTSLEQNTPRDCKL
ncbi:hypothetical protein JKP88DRAFT_312853, partial [Tribonema minus]